MNDPDRTTEVVLPNNEIVLVTVKEAAGGGPRDVGLRDHLPRFEEATAALAGIAESLTNVWRTAQPAKATVELGLTFTLKAGKLTSMIVGADGGASMKVTLEWTRSPAGAE